MAKRLSGKEVTAALNARIRANVETCRAHGVEPTLCMVRVGDNPSDMSYERGAAKRCETLGVACKQVHLPEDVSQDELLSVIEDVNQDPAIHGLLLFRPLPKHLDQALIENALDPAKDVDCMTDLSMSGVFTGKQIGKPAAMMLIKKNATVTICHTRTKDMPAVTRDADLIIVAAGRAGVIGADYVREGQTIIDVGINVNAEGKLCGDVDFAAVEPVVDAITPVPGGVGTVTTSVLVGHVADAALKTLDA